MKQGGRETGRKRFQERPIRRGGRSTNREKAWQRSSLGLGKGMEAAMVTKRAREGVTTTPPKKETLAPEK
jgi:hypothetical protein